MQVKNMRYHLIAVRMAIIKRQEKSFGEDMEKRKLSYNVSGSCKLVQAL